jgi:hypothetical protein
VIRLPEEPQGSANLTIKINMGIVKGGLFWTNVYLDNKLMTRMPLFINVMREGGTNVADTAPDANQKKNGKKEAK